MHGHLILRRFGPEKFDQGTFSPKTFAPGVWNGTLGPEPFVTRLFVPAGPLFLGFWYLGCLYLGCLYLGCTYVPGPRLFVHRLVVPGPYLPGLFVPEPFVLGLFVPGSFDPGFFLPEPFVPGLFVPEPFFPGCLYPGHLIPGCLYPNHLYPVVCTRTICSRVVCTRDIWSQVVCTRAVCSRVLCTHGTFDPRTFGLSKWGRSSFVPGRLGPLVVFGPGTFGRGFSWPSKQAGPETSFSLDMWTNWIFVNLYRSSRTKALVANWSGGQLFRWPTVPVAKVPVAKCSGWPNVEVASCSGGQKFNLRKKSTPQRPKV